jgi:hypothetical protein
MATQSIFLGLGRRSSVYCQAHSHIFHLMGGRFHSSHLDGIRLTSLPGIFYENQNIFHTKSSRFCNLLKPLCLEPSCMLLRVGIWLPDQHSALAIEDIALRIRPLYAPLAAAYTLRVRAAPLRTIMGKSRSSYLQTFVRPDTSLLRPLRTRSTNGL